MGISMIDKNTEETDLSNVVDKLWELAISKNCYDSLTPNHKSLKVNRVKMAPSEAYKASFAKYQRELKDIVKDVLGYDYDRLTELFTARLIKELDAWKVITTLEAINTGEDYLMRKPQYRDSYILVDKISGNKIIILGASQPLEKRQVAAIQYESYLSIIPKEFHKHLAFITQAGSFVYDSQNKKKCWLRTDMTISGPDTYEVWNLADPPPYLDVYERNLVDGKFLPKGTDKQIAIEAITAFNRYMCQLFVDKDQREAVYCWMWNCLKKRCQTYLVLNGTKGCGKTVFTEMLSRLVGLSASGSAPKSLFQESNFNASLTYKRLCIIDDINLTHPGTVEVLKNIINNKIAVEQKGKDPIQIDNSNSFVICCNYSHDLHITQDDRRFSVPDLAKERLSLYENEPWFKLMMKLKDGEDGDNTLELASIYAYIKEKYSMLADSKYTTFYAIKTSKTFRNIQAAAKTRFHIVIDNLLLDMTRDNPYEPIGVSDLMEKYVKASKIRGNQHKVRTKDDVLEYIRQELNDDLTVKYEVITPDPGTRDEKGLFCGAMIRRVQHKPYVPDDPMKSKLLETLLEDFGDE